MTKKSALMNAQMAVMLAASMTPRSMEQYEIKGHAEDTQAKQKRRVYRTKLPKAVGSAVGRNEPCVCGNGKKYKKCCILKPQPTGEST